MLATFIALGITIFTSELSAQVSEPLVGPQIDLSGPITNVVDSVRGFGGIAAVASNGKGYLVVWENQGDIYGARVSRTGFLLDTNPIVISAAASEQFAPAVASDGSNYLVVWQQCRDAGSGCDFVDIYGARISFEGSVLDAGGLVISAVPTASQGRPVVASNGADYLVARAGPSSGIWGTKVTKEGVAFDADRRLLLNAADWLGVDLIGNGTNYLLVAVSGSPPSSSIQGIRIANDLTLLDGIPLQLSRAEWPFFQHDPAVGSAGGDYLVVWMDNFASPVGGPSPRASGHDISGTRATTSGVVLDFNPLSVCNAADWQGIPRVAGVGNGFITTWQDDRIGSNSSIYAAEVTRSGGVPNPQGVQVASGSDKYGFPDLVSDGKDCLIVYQVDGPSGPRGVRANLFHASLSPTLSTVGVIPITFWLQSYGFSQGAAIFGTDKTTVWGGGGGAGGGRGFNVAVINLLNLAVEETRNFDTWADRSTGGAHRAFVDYLDGITNGRLVLVAVGDEAGLTQWGDFRCTKLPYTWVDEVIGKLQSLGSTNIAHYCYNDSWGMIFVKGQTPPLAEGLGSGLTFPNPLYLYATFPRTVQKPVMSITTQVGGGGFTTYTLTVTNVVPGRDVEIQCSDALQQSWLHLRTLNNPPTNVVQASDFIMFSPARFFKANMDSSVQLPPGF